MKAWDMLNKFFSFNDSLSEKKSIIFTEIDADQSTVKNPVKLHDFSLNEHIDQSHGSDINSLITNGDDRSNEIYGSSDNDTIFGNEGNDLLYGGDQSDTLYGGYYNDFIFGDAGDDRLFGDQGEDVVDGGDKQLLDLVGVQVAAGRHRVEQWLPGGGGQQHRDDAGRLAGGLRRARLARRREQEIGAVVGAIVKRHKRRGVLAALGVVGGGVDVNGVVHRAREVLVKAIFIGRRRDHGDVMQPRIFDGLVHEARAVEGAERL